MNLCRLPKPLGNATQATPLYNAAADLRKNSNNGILGYDFLGPAENLVVALRRGINDSLILDGNSLARSDAVFVGVMLREIGWIRLNIWQARNFLNFGPSRTPEERTSQTVRKYQHMASSQFFGPSRTPVRSWVRCAAERRKFQRKFVPPYTLTTRGIQKWQHQATKVASGNQHSRNKIWIRFDIWQARNCLQASCWIPAPKVMPATLMVIQQLPA